MNIEGKEKKDCSGCFACIQACPVFAISKETDNEGFSYPKVDKMRCIDCGLCEKACPTKERNEEKITVRKVYEVKHKSEKVRKFSASGGVFMALCQLVINSGGTVYGAAYNSKFIVEHIRAVTLEECAAMQGSKYVQSDLKDTYKQVKKDLDANREVLFTGTPCQTAGLQGFLKKGYPNLIVCDLICHGTPSPKIFGDYINYLQKRQKSRLKLLSFRDKEQGWINQMYKAEYENGKKQVDTIDLLRYKTLFYGHYILRPSCHNCKFTNLNRPSDMTMGDFFNVGAYDKEFFDKSGVSILLVNSGKGEETVEKLKKYAVVKPVDSDCYMQPQLSHPTKPSPDRKAFFDMYSKKGFSKAFLHFGKIGLKKRMKLMIPLSLKNKLKRMRKGN